MNALMHENSEAFVTGNETIERGIASMREKMDRDHAALAANQAALSEKVNTVHHVLRDKIDERHAALSAGQAALRDKMDAGYTALSKGQEALRDKLDVTSKELHSRIDTLNKDLSHKIDAGDKALSDKIDTVNKELGNKVDRLGTAFAELRGLHKTVLWVCGSIVTVVTVSLSIGKAVGWI